MAPILFCFTAGALMILLRRRWARGIRRSQEFWFDRAYDEDALAWWTAAFGGLLIVLGTVFLAIWVFK